MFCRKACYLPADSDIKQKKMDQTEPGEVEDLATLARLDEKVLLNELKIRYDNNKIYVSRITIKVEDGTELLSTNF